MHAQPFDHPARCAVQPGRNFCRIDCVAVAFERLQLNDLGANFGLIFIVVRIHLLILVVFVFLLVAFVGFLLFLRLLCLDFLGSGLVLLYEITVVVTFFAFV